MLEDKEKPGIKFKTILKFQKHFSIEDYFQNADNFEDLVAWLLIRSRGDLQRYLDEELETAIEIYIIPNSFLDNIFKQLLYIIYNRFIQPVVKATIQLEVPFFFSNESIKDMLLLVQNTAVLLDHQFTRE